ncbi:hypothetical protein IMG5_198770 [Ichthyophthirius multifiliis]|uniref:WH2 domain-containing protein n=1 Tax=Ichthyophthirius multifiliis TaxID=5932 RepID=G0R5G3_ICHMU|nr:hypothetical protein IMG5_198770 [Ichthyophthirius multifiliis]EGR27285.1 hypothetical protein IMG5_198770 [Ichthyophthirius multifiliis]|eukprot:XP_004024169.1 hypothetical protein IMG5_198770 [Ichthyophthirius multifiliis]
MTNNGIPIAPTMNIPLPPSISIQPPSSVVNMPPPPPSNIKLQNPTQISSNRGALLDQIKNPGIKLKKTITIEKGGLNATKMLQNTSGKQVQQNPVDILKQQIAIRFAGKNPPSSQKQKQKKNSDSENQDSDDN